MQCLCVCVDLAKQQSPSAQMKSKIEKKILDKNGDHHNFSWSQKENRARIHSIMFEL